jgi:MATE family multidrug resistance protein
MGEDELAANQIAFKILSLSFLPGYGISEAATVLTGQYVGAGDSRNVHRAFRSSLTLSVGFMGVLGVLFWVLPEPFIRVFNEDQAIVAAGAQLLAIAAVFQVFDAVAMTASGALNGAGDTRFTMFASIFSTWCVLVPFSYFFAVVLQMGLPGAWMGMTVEIISLAVILTYRFKTEGWRAQQVSI